MSPVNQPRPSDVQLTDLLDPRMNRNRASATPIQNRVRTRRKPPAPRNGTSGLSSQDVLLSAQTEAQFQRQVVQWAKQGDWLVHAMHDSRRLFWGCDRGVPDLLLVHAQRKLVVLAELKTDRGRAGPGQVVWASSLRIAGADVRLWRPRMWREIREFLLGG